MSTTDERTERLIVRHLDGESTPDEQSELDRLLLRCPEARALLQEYERIDRAAAAALGSVVADRGGPAQVLPMTAPGPSRRGYGRAWWALPAAVAAAVTLVVMFSRTNTRGPQLVDQGPIPAVQPSRPQPGTLSIPQDLNQIRQAGHRAGTVKRSTDTGLLYIVGPDGNVYVIEQQRIRTARTPGSAIRTVSGDL